VNLPNDHEWFNYFTKLRSSVLFETLHLRYDEPCGLYVKAGSIVPIKLHKGALSIERALKLPVRLEIYLDQVT
jgi:hypothetical protein